MAVTATVPRETSAPPITPTIITARIESIDVGDNVRSDVGDLTELVESIRQHGVLQPIRIRAHAADGRFTLVYGQRRLLAARQAGLKHITAIVDHGTDEVDRSVTQLVENLQRQDLNPLEEARALRQVLDAEPQLTQAELARRIGRSAPYVSNALRILELDAKVLPLVESGKLSGAHAKALVGLKGEAQRTLARNAIATGWSSHDLERQVQWQRERDERDAQEQAALATWATETEALIIADGGDKKASTITTVDGYAYGPTETAIKALKARGWKAKTQSWARGKQCTCSAWGIQRDYGGGTHVKRRCIVEAHYAAKRKAEGKPVDGHSAQEQRSRESYRQSSALQGLIRQPVKAEFRKLDANVGRLLLWSLLRYSVTDWFKEHKGDRKKPEPWAQLAELSVSQLADELTNRFLNDVSPHYGIHLDWPAIAAAFGVPLPAEKRARKVGAK